MADAPYYGYDPVRVAAIEAELRLELRRETDRAYAALMRDCFGWTPTEPVDTSADGLATASGSGVMTLCHGAEASTPAGAASDIGTTPSLRAGADT